MSSIALSCLAQSSQLPRCNLFTQHAMFVYLKENTSSELWSPVQSLPLIHLPQLLLSLGFAGLQVASNAFESLLWKRQSLRRLDRGVGASREACDGFRRWDLIQASIRDTRSTQVRSPRGEVNLLLLLI